MDRIDDGAQDRRLAVREGLSAEKGNYISLSEVGARIWDLIETPRSVEDVCKELPEEFEVAPDVCRAEVDAFLADTVKHAVIALDPAPFR